MPWLIGTIATSCFGFRLLEELDPERQYALVLDYAMQRVGLPEDELVPADPSER